MAVTDGGLLGISMTLAFWTSLVCSDVTREMSPGTDISY